MSVTIGTLEDEDYQAAVTPSPSIGSGQAPPAIAMRLAGPLRTAVVLSVRIGAPGDGTSTTCCDGALDFSTPLEKTLSYR